MNADEIRERFRNAPDWLMVDVYNRLIAIESRLDALSMPAPIETKQPAKKRGRPRKVENGTV